MCAKLPKVGFTKLRLFTNVSAIFTSLTKPWSHATDLVFLKKLHNLVIVR